ncbi:MAG: DUF4129 domain-containing protein [Thermoanaerobaculia bacterium]
MTRSLRSSPERLLAALLLALALLGGAPAGARAADAGAEARGVLSDKRYQPALPPHPEEKLEPGRREPVPGFDGGSGGRVILPTLSAGVVLGKVIFIVLLIVVLVLLAGWIVQGMAFRRREASEEAGADGSGEAAAAEPEPAFEDASRLAAEGRYAEAVHALLLAAIRHFAERARVTIQPSRTSRELVRLLPLGPDAREAFAELVRTVELSLFGGAPVAAEDYERSLARFRALTRRSA